MRRLKWIQDGVAVANFPIITLRENGWIIASTPILDLSAQGKTEDEAIKNLEAMIDDYMTDPDTRIEGRIRQMGKKESG